MGLYDRDYYQDSNAAPHGSPPSGPRMMVTNLVILNAGIFLLELFLTREGPLPGQKTYWLSDLLAARPEILTQPWLWWKLVTYGFVHDPTSMGHVFWNMFGLWVFGRDVELVYGRKELLRIYLTAIVLGGLAWCLREYFFASDIHTRLIGASGAVTTIVLLFVFHFPKRTILLMFVLPVPAWIVGLLIIGGNVLMLLQPHGNMSVAFDVHLVGAAFAIAYFYFGWNLGRMLPKFGSLGAGMRWGRRRPKLRIHDPEPVERRDKQDAEADRILAKVNREGIDSLSSKERRVLEEYSRRMRQKHR